MDNQDNTNAQSNKEKYLLEIKPTFNILYFISKDNKARQDCLRFVIPIVLIVIAKLVGHNTLSQPIYNYLMLALSILFIITSIYVIIKYTLQAIQYDKIFYTFYKDRLVIKDSFLNISENEIMYANIRELEFNATVIDRLFNMGIIYLHTSVEPDGELIKNLMICVKDPQTRFTMIEEIVRSK